MYSLLNPNQVRTPAPLRLHLALFAFIFYYRELKKLFNRIYSLAEIPLFPVFGMRIRN